MEKAVNYTFIVVIVLILAYFFKPTLYNIASSLKNIVNLSVPSMNFLYI